jgi:hypothetical protein
MNTSLTLLRQQLAARMPRDMPARVVAVVIVLLALFLVADWVARLSAPRPVASLPETRVAVAPMPVEPANRLLGIEAGKGPSMTNITLTGVFAAPGGGGFATFRVPKGQVSAVPGGAVQPGVRLARVGKDHVVLDTAAGEQRVNLTKEAVAMPAVVREDR